MDKPISHHPVEVEPYPSSLLSGWLPQPSSSSWTVFFKNLHTRPKSVPKAWASEVQELYDFLKSDPATEYFLACDENEILTKHVDIPIPRIKNAEQFASSCNSLLTEWPKFYGKMLVGLPFSALASGIDATISGSRCHSLPGFNKAMSAILKKWAEYLETPASAECFSKEGEQWLSDEAKKSYNFELWAKDSQTLPYWKSWNSFYTRQFQDPTKDRPIAHPDSNQIVNSPNDGSLLRWDCDIAEDDLFWLKDMNYSLRRILSSSDPQQQQLIDEYRLVEMFLGGYIFQTLLSPYNYHRWWAPVSGKVLFDPFVIPGVYFNKLVMPDFEGASTVSLPYLCHVNSRGIVVFQTQDFGNVCCIPIGMSEVSSVVFDEAVKRDSLVRKGQEIGMFKYGGSSFVVLFQKLEGKELVFHNGKPRGRFPQYPSPPTSPSSLSDTTLEVGSPIGAWYSL